MSCKKKNCGCQELIYDVVAQDRLRTNFVELLERSESSDIGILLLLTYTIVKSVNRFRKCYAYKVPSLDDTEKKTGSVSLCKKDFYSLFNFLFTKLKTRQKRKKDPNKCITVQIKKKPKENSSFADFA